MESLAADTAKAEGIEDILEQAKFYHETVLAEMEVLRSWTDKAEAIIPDEYLPYPTDVQPTSGVVCRHLWKNYPRGHDQERLKKCGTNRSTMPAASEAL